MVDLWQKMERAASDRAMRRDANKRALRRHPHKTKPLKHVAERVPNESSVAARLAEIPADTRTEAARLLGDPIPNDPRRQHG